MQTVPLQPVPSQRLQVVLANQNCQIAIYQKPQGLFFDLNADGVDIVLGVIMVDTVPLNPCVYMPFVGNFLIVDTQGSEDPTYDGLGVRYQLIYLTAEEYEQFQQ